MPKRAVTNYYGWRVQYYQTDEIAKHTKGQVKWQKLNLFKKRDMNLAALREFIIKQCQEGIPDHVVGDREAMEAKIKAWPGGGKLVVDSEIDRDAREQIDHEARRGGIPFFSIVVEPCLLEEVVVTRCAGVL